MVQSGKFRKRKKILKNIYTEIYFANFPFIRTEVNFEKVTNGRTLVKSPFNVSNGNPHCPKAFAHRPGLQTQLTIHTGMLNRLYITSRG